jgi:hypothetical protein
MGAFLLRGSLYFSAAQVADDRGHRGLAAVIFLGGMVIEIAVIQTHRENQRLRRRARRLLDAMAAEQAAEDERRRTVWRSGPRVLP